MPEKLRRKLDGSAVFLTTLLIFLLPLKFGGLAAMPETGSFYPEDLFSWLHITYPAHSLGIAGAAILAFAVLSSSRTLPGKIAVFIPVWSILPLAAALPGIIRGYAGENLGELANLAGIGTFSAAASLLIAEKKERGKLFAAAFLLGGLVCAVYGIFQHFTGLDELREFVAEQMRQGVAVSDAMRLKLSDPRIFSTMASSNILASLLLMIIPLAVYFAFVWGKNFEPVKISQRFFAVIFLAVAGTALFLTSSRSAIFCPAAAVIVAALSHPRLKKNLQLAAVTGLLIVLLLTLIWAIRFGRGTASMVERADYLRTAAVMTAKYPVAGGGWGSFFRTHMTMKFSDTDESARDPHNIIAAFASQAGVFAAIAMSAVLLLPLVMLWKYRFVPGLPMAVFWNGMLFSLHSLIDCDWHAPALPAAMGVLYAAAISEIPTGTETRLSVRWLQLLLTALIPVSLALNIHYLRGDHALAQLCDRISPASAEVAQKKRHLKVADLTRDAARLRPREAIPWVMQGNYLLGMGDLAGAEASFLHAAELDPIRPGVWAKLAHIALRQNRREEAEKLMLKAHRIFPKNPRYNVQEFLSQED